MNQPQMTINHVSKQNSSLCESNHNDLNHSDNNREACSDYYNFMCTKHRSWLYDLFSEYKLCSLKKICFFWCLSFLNVLFHGPFNVTKSSSQSFLHKKKLECNNFWLYFFYKVFYDILSKGEKMSELLIKI